MKAQRVFENINFERGKDIKNALELGKYQKRRAEEFDKENKTFFGSLFPGRKKYIESVNANMKDDGPLEMIVNKFQELLPAGIQLSDMGMNHRRREISAGLDTNKEYQEEFIIKFNGDIYSGWTEEFLGNMFDDPNKVKFNLEKNLDES